MSTPYTEAAASEPNPLMRFFQAWNRFWFNPADPTPLGLVRICCGLVVLYVHFAYTFDLMEFMGPNAWVDIDTITEYRHGWPWQSRSFTWNELPDSMPGQTPEELEYMKKWSGLNPRQVHAFGYSGTSLWYHVTDPTWMWIVHGLILFTMFLFTIGFCTRITSVLAWLGALTYLQRAPTSLFGMDTIMNIALLYCMIGPSGSALSMDRLIQRYFKIRQTLRKRSTGGSRAEPLEKLEIERPAPRVSANLALRLLQVHLCIIYFISGISKLQGQAWWSGTAIWGTMIDPEFSPVHNPYYLSFVTHLCHHRWLWEVFVTGGVLFTLVFEIGFPFLVWNSRLRWLMVAAAVMLHTGIALIMGLVTFSLMMITIVLSFVPAEAIHRILRFLFQGKTGYQLGYHPRSESQIESASAVEAFDVWNQVELIEHAATQKMDATRLQLVTPDRETLVGYPLFERATRSLRLLWPVALLTWIPGVKGFFQNRHAESGHMRRSQENSVNRSKKESVSR